MKPVRRPLASVFDGETQPAAKAETVNMNVELSTAKHANEACKAQQARSMFTRQRTSRAAAPQRHSTAQQYRRLGQMGLARICWV